jgi:hypothetical protein
MITGYDAFRWSLIALAYPAARPPEVAGRWVTHLTPEQRKLARLTPLQVAELEARMQRALLVVK